MQATARNFPAGSSAPISKNGKPPLWLCCPSLERGTLDDLKGAVRKAVGIVRESRDFKAGIRPEVVVLFNECSAHFQYYMGMKEAERQVESVRAQLPRDMWIAVSFVLLETTKSNAYKAGYFVSQSGRKKIEKRNYSESDEWKIRDELLEAGVGGDALSRLKISAPESAPFFSRLKSPAGRTIEHWVCGDVAAIPFEPEPDVISVVSADTLLTSMGKEIIRGRKNIGNIGDYDGIEELYHYDYDPEELPPKQYRRQWDESAHKAMPPKRKAIVVNDAWKEEVRIFQAGGEGSWQLKRDKTEFLFLPILD